MMAEIYGNVWRKQALSARQLIGVDSFNNLRLCRWLGSFASQPSSSLPNRANSVRAVGRKRLSPASVKVRLNASRR